jgi:hypothetical protein
VDGGVITSDTRWKITGSRSIKGKESQVGSLEQLDHADEFTDLEKKLSHRKIKGFGNTKAFCLIQ